MEDILYDVIIIGASKEGINAYNSLKRAMPEKKVIVISRDFDNVTTRNSVLTTDRIYGNVVFTNDRRGIMLATLENDERIAGLCMIIATGARARRKNLGTNRVYYSLKDVKTRAKASPIVLIGGDHKTCESALALSAKFSHVYVCLKEAELPGTAEQKATIEAKSNITVLPLCQVKSCRNDKNGNLLDVTLDTLDTIKCNYIFVSDGQVPELDGIYRDMITVDSKGYIIINDDFETEVVPGVYAVGKCVSASPKPRDASRLIAAYRKKFGGMN